MTLLMKLTLTVGLASMVLTGLWWLCHRYWDNQRVEYHTWLHNIMGWADDWLNFPAALGWAAFGGLGLVGLLRFIWGF